METQKLFASVVSMEFIESFGRLKITRSKYITLQKSCRPSICVDNISRASMNKLPMRQFKKYIFVTMLGIFTNFTSV